MSQVLRFVIAGLCLLAWVAETQATILVFDGLANSGTTLTNAPIFNTFGDNVAAAPAGSGLSIANGATPNIGLTWSAQVNSAFDASAVQRWEFYNTGDWKAAQLNSVYEAFAHNLTFTPDAGYGVLVDSFVVDDWAAYKGGNQLLWNLFQDSVGGTLIAFGTANTTNGQNLLVNTGMASAYFGTVVLQFIGGDDPDDTVFGNANRANSTDYQGIDDLAIDNISFQQVPEPGTMILAGMAAIGLGLCIRKRS